MRIHKSLGRDMKLINSAPTQERVILSRTSGTEAVYNPNFEIGMQRLDLGLTPLKKQLSRNVLPSGKP